MPKLACRSWICLQILFSSSAVFFFFFWPLSTDSTWKGRLHCCKGIVWGKGRVLVASPGLQYFHSLQFPIPLTTTYVQIYVTSMLTEEKLHDFYVVVSNTPTVDVPPALPSPAHTVCTFHPGIPARTKTFLHCDDTSLYGQYVTIQINSNLTAERLTLCEVDIYSGKNHSLS